MCLHLYILRKINSSIYRYKYPSLRLFGPSWQIRRRSLQRGFTNCNFQVTWILYRCPWGKLLFRSKEEKNFLEEYDLEKKYLLVKISPSMEMFSSTHFLIIEHVWSGCVRWNICYTAFQYLIRQMDGVSWLERILYVARIESFWKYFSLRNHYLVHSRNNDIAL